MLQYPHLHKRGSCQCCDNHIDISRLLIASKICPLFLVTASFDIFECEILLECQRRFLAGHGTVDTIFTARQLQNGNVRSSYVTFFVYIEMTKASNAAEMAF